MHTILITSEIVTQRKITRQDEMFPNITENISKPIIIALKPSHMKYFKGEHYYILLKKNFQTVEITYHLTYICTLVYALHVREKKESIPKT